MTRTDGERLAVIEEVVLRIEAKLDGMDQRVGWLERAYAYASGAATLLLTGIALAASYFKFHK